MWGHLCCCTPGETKRKRLPPGDKDRKNNGNQVSSRAVCLTRAQRRAEPECLINSWGSSPSCLNLSPAAENKVDDADEDSSTDGDDDDDDDDPIKGALRKKAERLMEVHGDGGGGDKKKKSKRKGKGKGNGNGSPGSGPSPKGGGKGKRKAFGGSRVC